MTTFDKREEGFEAKYIHDEELRFKVMARCNKMLGNWAAAQLGLTGEAAVAYANGLVTADLENQTMENTLAQGVKGSLEKRYFGTAGRCANERIPSRRAGAD